MALHILKFLLKVKQKLLIFWKQANTAATFCCCHLSVMLVNQVMYTLPKLQKVKILGDRIQNNH